MILSARMDSFRSMHRVVVGCVMKIVPLAIFCQRIVRVVRIWRRWKCSICITISVYWIAQLGIGKILRLRMITIARYVIHIVQNAPALQVKTVRHAEMSQRQTRSHWFLQKPTTTKTLNRQHAHQHALRNSSYHRWFQTIVSLATPAASYAQARNWTAQNALLTIIYTPKLTYA